MVKISCSYKYIASEMKIPPPKKIHTFTENYIRLTDPLEFLKLRGAEMLQVPS